MTAILPFVVMTCGMFIALLDIQVVASSLQDIGGGLSASRDEISWVQTAYLIAEIVMIPLSGWLTRVFSTRWLFTASAAGFTLASLLCALAWDIDSMIVFRALQGVLGASMIPTVFTSSFHYFQGARRVYAAAVIGTIAAVAPTLGPVIGGWITDALGWRWLFYVNLVPGLAIAAAVPFLVRIDKPDLSLLRGADYLGIALMAAGLGTLEYVLEEGTRWNWFDDATIRLCAWVSALALAGFAVRSLTHRNPVVDLRALGDRNFGLGCLLSFTTGVGIFTTIYLTPLFLGYVRGYSAWQTGAAVFSTGAASLLGTPVYIMLARRLDIRWLMMFGLACFGASMWSFSFVTSEWGAAELLARPRGPAAGAAEIRQRAVQHDAQPRRRGRHRGQRGDRQRPHQPALPPHRLAPDAGQRADGAPRLQRGRPLRRAAGGPAGRASGRAGAAVAAGVPGGVDAGLRRRVPHHHAGVRRRDAAGAAAAPGRGAQAGGDGCGALMPTAQCVDL